MGSYDPLGTADAGILVATNSMIQFTADHNRNGVLVTPGPPASNDPHEDITYSLRPEADPNDDGIATVFPSELRRASWGVPQPLAENVEVLNFVYLDENNAVMATPVTGADLDRIRSVQVFIVVRSDQEDKHYKNTSTYTNLLYDRDPADAQALTWNAPNDGYRRRVLKTTVNCRNAGI
jgi:type IV pilus assembly protein PilW